MSPADIIPFRIECQADGELRISDVELAERLEYSDVKLMRQVINRNRTDLLEFGLIFTVKINTGAAGRPEKEFWLNRAQAVHAVYRSETPKARQIAISLTKAFDSLLDRARNNLPLTELFRLAILNDQVRQWQKEFPDGFFHNLHRVLGLARPSIGNHSNCAHFINRFIYGFLFGKLGLSVIRDANPSDDEGSRAHRHHQLLKEKHLPKLRSHIEKVDGLLANATSLQHFEDMFTRAFPQSNTQIGFLFATEAPRLQA